MTLSPKADTLTMEQHQPRTTSKTFFKQCVSGIFNTFRCSKSLQGIFPEPPHHSLPFVLALWNLSPETVLVFSQDVHVSGYSWLFSCPFSGCFPFTVSHLGHSWRVIVALWCSFLLLSAREFIILSRDWLPSSGKETCSSKLPSFTNFHQQRNVYCLLHFTLKKKNERKALIGFVWIRCQPLDQSTVARYSVCKNIEFPGQITCWQLGEELFPKGQRGLGSQYHRGVPMIALIYGVMSAKFF